MRMNRRCLCAMALVAALGAAAVAAPVLAPERIMDDHPANTYVFSVAYSPDGARIATGAWDGTVRLWDGATGALLRVVHDGWSMVHTVAFSPDGTFLATGARDRAIRVWRVEDGAEHR